MQSHSVWAFVVTLALVYLQNTESISISYSDSDQDSDKAQLLESACRIICSTPVQCPPSCLQLYLSQATPSTYQKRAPGLLNGFTFDDYLFMRLLGRNMRGPRIR